MSEATSQVDCCIFGQNSEEWEKVISYFDDASIYQTVAYAKTCYGERNTETLVVRRDSKPIAAAVVNVRRLPRIPFGVAYVFYGPLWRTGGEDDLSSFSHGIEALVQEYARTRGLALRIRPFLHEGPDANQCDGALRAAGFHPLLHLPQKKTLLIDLSKPVGELRKGLAEKWRGHLNRAERNGLTVVEGTNDELFDQLNPIHMELLERKQLQDVKGIDVFKAIQSRLARDSKLRVFLCVHSGVACAGIIVSAIGTVGITLSRATNEIGRQQQAAYLVQWRALQWLKEAGCQSYDLSGVDEGRNPGTHSYKAGLCGKNGTEVSMMPQYQMCNMKLKELMLSLVERGLRSAWR